MTRLPRWLRFVLLGVATVGAICLLAWLWGRDLPRRMTRDALAERIGAKVRLGRLTIAGSRRFVLHDLSVESIEGQPWIERVEIGRLEVTGSLGAIRAGNMESMIAVDAVIRLAAPAEKARAPAAGTPLQVRVGHLELPEARVVLVSAGGEAQALLDATIDGFGEAPSGQARLHAESLPLAPFLALASGTSRASGTLEGVVADLTIRDGGKSATLVARSEALVLDREGRSTRVGSLEAEIGITVREGGPVVVDVRPSLSFLEQGTIRAEVDPRTGELLALAGSLRALDLAVVAETTGWLPAGWSVDGRADLEIRESGRSAFDYRLAADLDRTQLGPGPRDVIVEDARLELEGTLSRKAGALGGPVRGVVEIPRAKGTLGGTAVPSGLFPLSARIRAELALSEPVRGDGTLTVETKTAGRLAADGSIVLASGGPRARATWKWSGGSIESTLGLIEALELPEGTSATGRIEASGSIEGDLADPSVRARVRASDLTIVQEPATPETAPGFYLRNGSMTGDLVRRPRAAPIELRNLRLHGEAGSGSLRAVPIVLTGSAKLDPSDGSALLERTTLEMKDLALARLGVVWNPGPSPAGKAEAEIEILDLGRWQTYLRPLLGDFAPGYVAKGTAKGSFDLTFARDGTGEARGKVAIRGNGFSSADGANVVEGLDTDWDVRAERVAGGALAIHGTAAVGGFQALWGDFFADYSGLSSTLAVEGKIEPRSADAASTSFEGRARWEYPEGPGFVVSLGTAEGGALRYRLDVAIEDLGPALERYFRVPLGDSAPFLKKIRGAGALRASLSGLVGDDAQTIAGSVTLTGLRLEGTQGLVEVQGLSADLPLDLRLGAKRPDGSREVDGPPRSGSLRFAKLSAGGLELPPTETRIEVRGDTIRLEERLVVPVLGGTLTLENVALADALRPSRSAAAGILLSGIELPEACRAFGLPVLDGELNGAFPRVRLTGSAFAVDGGGELNVFGGTVKLGGISGEDVLSRYPKLTFSADFEEIDLGQVTRTFDFGVMTGIVRGYVHSCELFRGVPVRLDAEIATVEREGVERIIDVKALQNVAVLGTGGTAGVFSTGIFRLFDHYRYDGLGIHMTLFDDVFLLRGLERRGDRELFLKGKLPFRIDVVNVEPGKTVSFSTMLERLQSLDFKTATTTATRALSPVPAGPADRE